MTGQPSRRSVLVHRVCADASGWSRVTERLQRQGRTVLAPADAFRSLSGDSAHLAIVLANVNGPIVLVGQSYGRAVITNALAGSPNVRALVYINVVALDQGESGFSVGAEFPKQARRSFEVGPGCWGGEGDQARPETNDDRIDTLARDGAPDRDRKRQAEHATLFA
jgi:pimeloyl-ACP methyl ester carboxylesterase